MPGHTPSVTLSSPEKTARFAEAVGRYLTAGDTLLLSGPVGAGKTHFARHLIRSLQEEPEDVPSPTFTLVQTYETRSGSVWHADLYRISDPSEIEELGLVDAFEDAICLVEWPQNLGLLAPDNALTLEFGAEGTDDARQLGFSWTDPLWDERVRAWCRI